MNDAEKEEMLDQLKSESEEGSDGGGFDMDDSDGITRHPEKGNGNGDEPEDDPRISFNFSGVQNTSRAGTAHPIVYGEIVCGSVVISASVDTNQVVA